MEESIVQFHPEFDGLVLEIKARHISRVRDEAFREYERGNFAAALELFLSIESKAELEEEEEEVESEGRLEFDAEQQQGQLVLEGVEEVEEEVTGEDRKRTSAVKAILGKGAGNSRRPIRIVSSTPLTRRFHVPKSLVETVNLSPRAPPHGKMARISFGFGSGSHRPMSSGRRQQRERQQRWQQRRVAKQKQERQGQQNVHEQQQSSRFQQNQRINNGKSTFRPSSGKIETT